ncbi:hypothetical protein HXX76_015131 [Chlamydomonas incerta]|uniref:Uncharacterized protein n=1 Tax=Chlamydomonas incerta TaxID=51695 RepID=A0A835VRX4_CHLIN|nr:hypothetical protein HXX76_015131 [Chlamydomonas incerta]|eukprot:KAG2423613.1 hypothetical protein HXX76_015131 [Chlamydomonas incerta]
MLDGWFDGPSGDEAVDQENLLHLLVVMQSLQKFKYSSALAAAANAHQQQPAQLPAPPPQYPPPPPQYTQQQQQQQQPQFVQQSPYAPQPQPPPLLSTTSMRMSPGAMPSFAHNNGTNPLYELAPSPGQSGGGYGGVMSPLAAAASVRSDRFSPPSAMAVATPQQAPMQQVDAAVMQQLLTEIVRLQAELGENK